METDFADLRSILREMGVKFQHRRLPLKARSVPMFEHDHAVAQISHM